MSKHVAIYVRVIGAYEAVLAGHQRKLARGERAVVPVVAPSKSQGRIVKDYLRAIFDMELFRHEVISETRSGFELRSGVRIEILAGDWKTIRGYTCVAVVVDEVAFMGVADDESRVRSDTELIRAIKALEAVTPEYLKASRKINAENQQAAHDFMEAVKKIQI